MGQFQLGKLQEPSLKHDPALNQCPSGRYHYLDKIADDLIAQYKRDGNRAKVEEVRDQYQGEDKRVLVEFLNKYKG